MQELERKLGYRFRSGALLAEALRHSSYANEHRGAESVSNERLEFLGDSVLGFVTAEYLFARHPDSPEGELTAHPRGARLPRRACMRSRRSWSWAATSSSATVRRPAADAPVRPSSPDATEAVIAAVYLDGGLAAASSLITACCSTVSARRSWRSAAAIIRPCCRSWCSASRTARLFYRMAEESGPRPRQDLHL